MIKAGIGRGFVLPETLAPDYAEHWLELSETFDEQPELFNFFLVA